MKKNLCVVIFALFTSIMAFGGGSHEHPPVHKKHSFVFVDRNAEYATHVVYKKPHNFQVNIRLKPLPLLPYIAEAMASFPEQSFFIQFNPFDISKMNEKPDLSATIVREDSSGQLIPIAKDFSLVAGNYEVTYFEELPLDLN